MRAGDGQDEELVWRKTMEAAAREWGVAAGQVKPCVARMRGTREGPGRIATLVVAECRRLGVYEKRAIEIAGRWGWGDRPPPPPLKILVRSLYDHPRVVGCDVTLGDFCVGKRICPVYSQAISAATPEPGRATVDDLRRLGWRSPWLTAVERLMYSGLAGLEVVRGVGPGGPVPISSRQLALVVGVSLCGALYALRSLYRLGLIDHQPGRTPARGLPRRAGELRRVVPIPDLPRGWSTSYLRQCLHRQSGSPPTPSGGPSQPLSSDHR